jgi:anaerobic dimethyl sulfoxide reductase subunit C (anchor subunit)
MQQHKEWPLVFFTILTQMAVGVFTLSGLVAVVLPNPNPYTKGWVSITVLSSILITLMLGGLVATLHLNSPLKVRFSLTNLQGSWLSREAFLSGIFGLLVLSLLLRRLLDSSFGTFDTILILTGVIFGLGLVIAISRLYMLRTVPAWNHLGTPAMFFASTFLLGTAGNMVFWLIAMYWYDGSATHKYSGPILIISVFLIFTFVALQFGIFIFTILYLNNQGGKAAESVRALWADLKWATFWRWTIAFLAISFVIGAIYILGEVPSLYAVAILILLSEILGRYLFYGFYRREGI